MTRPPCAARSRPQIAPLCGTDRRAHGAGARAAEPDARLDQPHAASGEVYRAAFTYCAIIFAGIGAQLFYNFICSFLRSLGDSVTPLLFLLFSTALNVGLDLLFIVTFHWGVAGAAIATVLAQLLSTIGCFCYAFARYPKLRLHREDWAITRHDIGSMPCRASRSGCSSPCWPSASLLCRVLL